MKERKQKSKKKAPTKNANEDQAPAASYWKQNAGNKGGRQGKSGKFDSQPHSVGKKYWRK